MSTFPEPWVTERARYPHLLTLSVCSCFLCGPCTEDESLSMRVFLGRADPQRPPGALLPPWWFRGMAVTTREAQSRLHPLISAAGYLIKARQCSTAVRKPCTGVGGVLTNTLPQDCGTGLRSAPKPGLEIQLTVPLRQAPPAASSHCHGRPHLISFLSPSCCYTPFLLVCSMLFLLFWVLFGFAL